MAAAANSIQVGKKVGKAYAAVSPEEQRQINLLPCLRLQDLTLSSHILLTSPPPSTPEAAQQEDADEDTRALALPTQAGRLGLHSPG